MKNLVSIIFVLSLSLFVFTCPILSAEPNWRTTLPTKDKVAQYLQDISVTIKASSSEGSGVIRTVVIDGNKINFIITAAHVIESLKKTDRMIDPISGTEKQIVKFDDASVVKELVEDGKRVGELKMDARVVKYNQAEDLAIIRVLKKNFVDASVIFYMDDTIPQISTEVYHCGSLLGQLGSNSMTSGIISQIGRIIDQKEFDQTTAAAFPGCCSSDTSIGVYNNSEDLITNVEGKDVITYDDNIVMRDGTWKKSINQNDYVLSFQTKTGEILNKTGNSNNRPISTGKVTKVWQSGIKPIIKIATRNRSVRVSENHPFVRAISVPAINSKVYWIAQWCRADNLQVGDIVAVMKNHVQYRKSENLNFTKTFGHNDNFLPAMRLLGFYIGDGYSRIGKINGGETVLYTYNDNFNTLYTNIINKIFPNLKVKIRQTKSGRFLQIAGMKLAKFFYNLGVTGYAKTKRIPKWIFTCQPEYQREFLEGLIDADGHKRREYWSIELANEELIRDIWSLANNLGMGTSNIYSRQRKATLKNRIIESNTWTCDIYPNPSHESAQMDGTKDLLPKDLKWERITDITPDGEEMTYDMEVAPYHNFFANGFLVHNSSGGGIYTQDGAYIGCLTRGAGENFNLCVPIRRIKKWFKSAKLMWIIDSKERAPTAEELEKMLVEDIGRTFTIVSNPQMPTPAPTIPGKNWGNLRG